MPIARVEHPFGPMLPPIGLPGLGSASPMIVLARFLGGLPLAWLHALGALAGWLVYCASPRYRRVLRANLAQAGLDDAALRRRTIAAAGRQAFELLAVWTRPIEDVDALVREVSGLHLFEQARAARRGVVLVTPHIGCFDIAALWAARRFPITVLYRPPRVRALAPLMLGGRMRSGMKLAATDLGGVRQLMRALRAGECVGMLPDQVPAGGEGRWVSFFDRPAYTMTLATRLAESYSAPLLFAFCERLAHGQGFRLCFIAPPAPVPGEDPLRTLNRGLEMLIRSCPEQYLWGYNRYKRPAGVEPPPVAPEVAA